MKKVAVGFLTLSLAFCAIPNIGAAEQVNSKEVLQNKDYVLTKESEGYFYIKDNQGQLIGSLNKIDVFQSYNITIGDYKNKNHVEIGAQLAVDLGSPIDKKEIASLTSKYYFTDKKIGDFKVSYWIDNSGSFRLDWKKYSENIRVFMDDEEVKLDQAPIIKNGRTLVSVKRNI